MSIATKTGDDGTTDLIGGRRVPKDHPLMECLGTIDELNAFLGDAKAELARANGNPVQDRAIAIITGIQKELFTISGILAGSQDTPPDDKNLNALVQELETVQPPFTSFVIPGATAVSAKLHIARTVCRRAERRLVSLDHTGEAPAGIIPWFNRLADLLFLMARQEESDSAQK